MSSLLQKISDSLLINKDRDAFCFAEKFYTYNDLTNRIIIIMESVKESGLDLLLNPNVGVIANNDMETYASLIACWFLGIAYVPITHSLPKERISKIIEDAKIELILSSTYQSDEFILPETIITSHDRVSHGEIREAQNVSDNNIAYIIFTSGSTGVPKGVPISQGNLNTFIENFYLSGYPVDASDRCLQMFELTFDVSISSFLIPLLNGACVYPVGDKGIKYMQVLKCIQQYNLTNIQIVPSIIRLAGPLLKRFKFPWVRNCIVTGEASSVDLIPELKSCLTNACIFNFYGPTEATIYCSFYLCPDTMKNYHGMLSIGSAMGEMDMLILDKDLKEVENNIKGEIFIGGEQLSKGYLNNKNQTASSFIGLKDRKGQLYYKSGDMAFRDDEGDIYYCGRFDNQVKIQGYRIELGEIEHLVRDEFEMNNIVTVDENDGKEAQLILVLETGTSEVNENIIKYLKKQLPQYMIPSHIRILNEFPLTSSGKTDRKKINELALR